ncbi:MAG: DUF3710 domain-containing protein [Frankiaceae bacterium]
MFRRRRQDPVDPVDPGAEDDELLDSEDPDASRGGDDSAGGEPAPERTGGPWDADELPAEAGAGAEAEQPRVDLGGLRVPVRPDVELRVDMSPEGVVMAVTLMAGASALQVNAFAAPRTAGIWAEVRDEIATSLRAGGGSAEEAEGPFGTELRARVPGEGPGQGRALQPARFIGVDGPRWFLRGLLSGPAATDPVQAALLEDLFRGMVVVRGKDAMAPRDQLPLALPRELTEAAAAEAAEPGSSQPDINRLERGPEIAETR